MPDISFGTGLVEFTINGGRKIKFNPSDVGFMENLYDLVAKVDSISSDMGKKKDHADDPAKFFDIARTGDKKMREATDAMFGEGFCEDVFGNVRLYAMADGLTVLENLVFAIIDQMDESVKNNMSQRNDKISKYTAKYQKYSGK